LILLIALALLFARLFGYLFDRFNQPAVIGEILAGVFLGGVTLWITNTYEFLHITYLSEDFRLFADMGILFLLFLSGLQTHLSHMKKMEKSSSFVAVGGVILPFVLGSAAGLLYGLGPMESIVIGLILIATSVGVTVRTLLDLHVLDSDVGTTVLGAAVIDDILGILLLALVMGIESPVVVGIKIVIFFFIFLYLGLKVIDKILNLGDAIHLPKALLSISLTLFLIYAYFAGVAGIAGIIGAFVAGILIGNTIKSRKIIDDVEAIGYGFFIPLFFVWVGARLWEGSAITMDTLTAILILSSILIIVAIVGKLLGCGIAARLSGMTNRESLQIGVSMIPRMELALIISSSAIAAGLITNEQIAHQILAATVILTIVTTLLTPLLLKNVFKKHPDRRG